MRKTITIGVGLVAFGLATTAGSVSAQIAPEPQALVITALNTTKEATDRAADSGLFVPGDVIEYALRFTNVTDAAVQDVVLKDPIPDGLIMVLGSPSADREDIVVDYSIDGGTSWSVSPVVERLEDGRVVVHPAPAGAYTHVRWTIPGALPAGASVTARFRAAVLGRGEGADLQ